MNPAVKSMEDLQLFKFLGILFGVAVRTKKPLHLHLAPLVWKQLVGMPLTPDDIEEVGHSRSIYGVCMCSVYMLFYKCVCGPSSLIVLSGNVISVGDGCNDDGDDDDGGDGDDVDHADDNDGDDNDDEEDNDGRMMVMMTVMVMMKMMMVMMMIVMVG